MLSYNSSKLRILSVPTKPKNYLPRKSVTYVFYSLFSPASVNNLSLYLNNSVTSNTSNNVEANYRNKKVLIKQSYLLLVWLRSSVRKQGLGTKSAGFAFLPKTRSKFTMTKAPMAHKTFSQEQFSIQYRRLAIRLYLHEPSASTTIGTMLSVSNFHNNKLSIGTNLLFLSKVSFSLRSKDNSFFVLR